MPILDISFGSSMILNVGFPFGWNFHLCVGASTSDTPISGGNNVPGDSGVCRNMTPGEPKGPSFMHHNSFTNTLLPFWVNFNFPNLSQLKNDPIHHHTLWPLIPTKLPLDIPKFDERFKENPSMHIMTFQLWCPSNSLVEDNIDYVFSNET
jgi:hypothetical protein